MLVLLKWKDVLEPNCPKNGNENHHKNCFSLIMIIIVIHHHPAQQIRAPGEPKLQGGSYWTAAEQHMLADHYVHGYPSIPNDI